MGSGGTGASSSSFFSSHTQNFKKPSLSLSLSSPTGSPLGLFLALRQVNPAAGRGLGTPGAAALMPGAWALLSPSPQNAAAAADDSDKGETSIPLSHHSSRVYYDGLPACRRMYNLYHPFDPIAYRVEPLAATFPGGPSAAPRAVFAARAGGSRLHVGLREAAEDVGGALASGAAALGGALAAGIRSLRTVGAIAAMAVGGGGGGGGGRGGENNDNITDGAAKAAAASSSSSSSGIRFARVAPASARTAAAAEVAADAVALAAAERARSAGSAVERLTGGVPLAVGGGGVGGSGGIGGGGASEAGAGAPKATQPPSPPPGTTTIPPSSSSAAATTTTTRTARGRLDFQLQTGATENQYLSALSSHFGYWGSADVGLFVLRAVRGVDVRAGGGVVSSSATAAAAAAAAGEGVPAGAPASTSSSSFSSSPTRRAQHQQQKQQGGVAAGAPA